MQTHKLIWDGTEFVEVTLDKANEMIATGYAQDPANETSFTLLTAAQMKAARASGNAGAKSISRDVKAPRYPTREMRAEGSK
jgi:hypothetical protein